MRRHSLPGICTHLNVTPPLASPSHIPAPLGAMPPLRPCQGAGGTFVPRAHKPQHLLPLDLCHSPFSYPPPITVISILILTLSPGIWEQRPFPGVYPSGYPTRGNRGWLLWLLYYATLLSPPPVPSTAVKIRTKSWPLCFKQKMLECTQRRCGHSLLTPSCKALQEQLPGAPSASGRTRNPQLVLSRPLSQPCCLCAKPSTDDRNSSGFYASSAHVSCVAVIIQSYWWVCGPVSPMRL